MSERIAGYDLPALSDSAGSMQRKMMQDALMLHVGQRHTMHCWGRLAWGDGECECGELVPTEISAAVAAEREACAKLVELFDEDFEYRVAIAAAIRARGAP
jgi:hypothetical protein